VSLQSLLDDAQAWIKYETYPPKAAAAIFHHKHVCIRAFPNGNDRHARAMADAMFQKIYNADPISWKVKKVVKQITNGGSNISPH
jgi:fido (protein-threonine AMPylation protein)